MSTHETFREIDPSSEADGKSLWDLTWISLESIMPKLKEELFPDVAK